MADEIIDLKDVMERVQDDKELLLELLDIYQEDFVSKRQALAEGIATKDLVKVKEAAHSMKGASGNISAKPMHATCLAIEQLAKSNSTDGMDALLKNVDEYFVQIQAYAKKLKIEFGG